MRYPKDIIQLSQARDLPLLRQVLHSELVTHSQLFEFMRLNHHEHSHKSFGWRVRRLAACELLVRHRKPACTGELIYSIGRDAAARLQSMGEYSLIGRQPRNINEVTPRVLHATGLNDIHLAALRAGVLIRWTSSIEIRSQNELTRFGFAKDYDAIVTVGIDGEEYRFAMEYERNPKSARYYKKVAACLDYEERVQCILYLFTNCDLLRFVSAFFNQEHPLVLFGLVAEWHEQLLEMPVTNHGRRRFTKLGEALKGATVRRAAASK